ncbi:MAG: MarR family winged helix-turn-helix transcriptional regulator [archaeon]|nr:MarR family winged helix-turn-helix transcriptional regulator [archaeon]
MQKTVQISVTDSIGRELERIPKWKLMLFLQKHGETSAYDIAKQLGWSTGKVHAVIKQLEKSKAIDAKKKIINGRAVKLVRLSN